MDTHNLDVNKISARFVDNFDDIKKFEIASTLPEGVANLGISSEKLVILTNIEITEFLSLVNKDPVEAKRFIFDLSRTILFQMLAKYEGDQYQADMGVILFLSDILSNILYTLHYAMTVNDQLMMSQVSDDDFSDLFADPMDIRAEVLFKNLDFKMPNWDEDLLN